jgi:hypothetical protein
VLTRRKHDAPDSDHIHLIDDVANNDKGFLSRVAIGDDVVGAHIVKLVDLRFWNELVDLDRLFTLKGDRLDLFVGDLDVLVFVNLITLDDIGWLNLLAGTLIDLAIADATASIFVDLVEADLFALSRRREQLNGTGNERQA